SRRPGRTALIVLGLMLGTTIVAAALTTGDTMNHTIRSTAVTSLGATDETVAPKGAVDDIPGALGSATGTGWVQESAVAKVQAALAGSNLVDGGAGAVVQQVSVQAPVERRSEPTVALFAADASQLTGFSPIVGSQGRVSLAELRPGEIFLNRKAADKLGTRPGERVVVYTTRGPKPE